MTERQKNKKTKRKNDDMTKAQKEGMIKWQNDKKDSENLMIVYHKSLFFIGINLVSKKLCNKYLHQLHEITFNK